MMQRSKSFLTQIAKRAGSMMLEAASKEHTVTTKDGLGDYVTNIDSQIEKYLTETIQQAFPDDSFLAEEHHTDIDINRLPEHLWVIDPIDGTSNFIFQRNHSAISIAYVYQGKLRQGIVYDPFSSEVYYAEQGRGSFLNDVKLPHIASVAQNRANIATDNSYNPEIIQRHLRILQNIKPVPLVYIRGSAALALCWVSAGKLDAYFHTHIKPWDLAAGLLIAQEAGMKTVTFTQDAAQFYSQDVIIGKEEHVTSIIQSSLL